MNNSSAPDRRRIIPVAVATAALFLLAVATGSAATREKPAPQPRPEAPVRADRDGNKVFDDLEAKLDATASDVDVPVIVSLTVPPSSARLKQLEKEGGSFTVGTSLTTVDAFSTRLRKGQIEAFKHVPWVDHVEADAPVEAFNAAQQDAFGVTKAKLDLPGLDGDGDGSPTTYSKADLVAAVIDTGIDANHLDLNGGKVLAFKDLVNGRTAPYDDNGHGTHVAATIAGDGEGMANRAEAGVAPAAALVGVKVLDGAGSGSMSTVAAGIDWVVANKDVYGIEAINLSLGAAGCADGTDITSRAVNAAAAAGIVVAVAAGNSGPGPCTIGSPGAAADALTVGAMTDLSTGFSLAMFSSRGPTADGRIKPDIASPGVNVISASAGTTNGYRNLSGTSMATPFVAGVALLMRDVNPALTPQQVKDRMMATAVDWGLGGNGRTAGSRGADDEYGAGRLDAYAAVKAAGAALGTGPVVPAHVLREGTLAATGATAEFAFNVTSTQFPITATLFIPALTAASASTPDFEIYLLNSSGAQVGAAASNTRQETVSYRPSATGTYTVRVVSFSGAGDFFVDVSAALGDVTPPPPPPADTTPPTIGTLMPADGALSVAVSTKVSVTFSESMNTSATQGAFSLVNASGSAVSGSFSWVGNTLVFTPAADLAAGVKYTAKVTTAAKDVAGNALAADKIWSFTTLAPPPPTGFSVTPFQTWIYYGSLRAGDYTRLAFDDNLSFDVNSASGVADWYGRVTGVSNALTSLQVVYTGSASATCDHLVGLYNWTYGYWVRIDARSVGTDKVNISVFPIGTLADYVSGTTGDGDVAVRIRCTRTDGASFFTVGDLMKVSFTK